MFLGLPDPHPDPLVRGTDPRVQIRIRSKMSRIPNTASIRCSFLYLSPVDVKYVLRHFVVHIYFSTRIRSGSELDKIRKDAEMKSRRKYR